MSLPARANPLRAYEKHAAALRRGAEAFAGLLLPTDTQRVRAGRRRVPGPVLPAGLGAHCIAALEIPRMARLLGSQWQKEHGQSLKPDVLPQTPGDRPEKEGSQWQEHGQPLKPDTLPQTPGDRPEKEGAQVSQLSRVDFNALEPFIGKTSHGETLAQMLSLDMARRRDAVRHNVRAAVAAFARGPRDTGSAEVQAAVATARMAALGAHVAGGHFRDADARRRLAELEAARRGVLGYLRRASLARYYAVLDRLGLPHDLLEKAAEPYPAHWYPRRAAATGSKQKERK